MTQSAQPKQPAHTDTEIEVDFHGAAIIDENGKEVPITEDMVKDACEKMEDDSLHSGHEES